ncbi:MAG: hypothetical protein K5945_01955 [Bacteroidaceae bacterium]|nr:hypothetical protein [Bacteroidaceae bacterium]
MRRYSSVLSLILCTAMVLSGCKEKPVASKYDNINTAIGCLNEGLVYDEAGQMRLAELFYKKAYEMFLDEPSQNWDLYAEAGYRYACMRYQRGDMEGTLAVVSEVLDKVEGQKLFPAASKSGLLSLMAQCQMHLAMPEAAKQTFAKVYQNQLTVLGGENRGDFNMAMICANIFLSFFENGEYDEAGKWLGRYEEELLTCEQIGVGDSILIEEQKGSLALYKAQYLQATGHAREAADTYAAIPRSYISSGGNIQEAICYLMAAGRYDEAASWYEQLDSSDALSEGERMTFDQITSLLSPRYLVYRKCGRNDEALAIADSINAAINSALVGQKKSDAAELAVIYQTHERDLRIKSLQYTVSLHRLLFVAAGIILLLIAYLFLRAHKYNKVLLEKNRILLNDIEQHEKEEIAKLNTLQAQPEDTLTAEQKLYRRLCTMMIEQRPYIVKWTEGSDIANPVFPSVTVTSTEAGTVEAKNSGFGTVQFIGTYSPASLTPNDKSNLFIGESSTLYYPNAANNADGQYYVKSCRAYFHVDLDGSAGVRTFVLGFSDDATGISSLSPESEETKAFPWENQNGDFWYSLDGMKLDGKPTAKGIYIKRGKKNVVK